MANPAESETPTPPTESRSARSSAGNGREDCWTEEATAVLIEAWGERHLRCNRGNLRQTDWREVSDAVNEREDEAKQRKSEVQCKNRIDTLKKKYKVEKARSAPSAWQFFGQMDFLIGDGVKKGPVAYKKRIGRFRVTSSRNSNPNSSSSGIPNSSRLVESSDGESSKGLAASVGRKRRRVEVDSSPPRETAFSEVAKAFLKFGEIYERTESSKRKRLVELEKKRMEFTKELEIQRMNMLPEAQVEINKVMRSKNASNSGYIVFDLDDDLGRRLEHISKDEAAILSRVKRRSHSWGKNRRNLILFFVLLEFILRRTNPLLSNHLPPKVLIFSQWTKILDHIDYYLSEKGYKVCRIDGNVKLDERRSRF